MKNLLIIFTLVSCMPAEKSSQIKANNNPMACVVNDTRTVFTKAASSIVPPKLNKTAKGLEFDFRGRDIVQGAKNFCKDNKCFLNFKKNVKAVGNLPVGIGNTALVVFEQSKMAKGCKRSVTFFGRFRQDVLPVCIGEVLSASSTISVGIQNTPGLGSSGSVSAAAAVGGKVGPVIAEGQVGANVKVKLPENRLPRISAKMICAGKALCNLPFFKSYVELDSHGLKISPYAEINVTDSKAGKISFVNREDLGGTKQFKWKDIKKKCGGAICKAP